MKKGITFYGSFSEGVSGKWNMATLDEKGKWITYPMELSDRKAVEMFKKGMIPSRGR